MTWKVKAGDTVKVNDIIVEIETAKSLVELPCPYAGMVAELLVPEGDDGRGRHADHRGRRPATRSAPAAAPAAAAQRRGRRRRGRWSPSRPRRRRRGPVEPGLIGGPAPGGRTSVLVGYGPRTTEAKRRPRKGVDRAGRRARRRPRKPACSMRPSRSPARQPPETPVADADPADAGRAPPGASPAPVPAPAHVRCWPSRRSASWPRTSASTSATVDAHRRRRRRHPRRRRGAAAAGAAAAASAPSTPRSPTGERETRIPVKGVRKMTAQAMVASAFTAPHVTEWVTVDATRTMKLVARLREHRELPRRQGLAAAGGGPGGLPGGPAHAGDQRDLGRGSAGDRAQALRQPRHRRRHAARAGGAEHQGRRPDVACASSPTRWRR